MHRCPAARVYPDRVEATYDLHRVLLYDAARFPSPITPDDELACGRQLARYLTTGIAPTGMTYTTPDSA